MNNIHMSNSITPACIIA